MAAPAVSVRVVIKINGCNYVSVCPPLSLAVVRVPADEDRTAQAQHIHHPLPAVDHCHRAHLPRGDPRGEASEPPHRPAHTTYTWQQTLDNKLTYTHSLTHII